MRSDSTIVCTASTGAAVVPLHMRSWLPNKVGITLCVGSPRLRTRHVILASRGCFGVAAVPMTSELALLGGTCPSVAECVAQLVIMRTILAVSKQFTLERYRRATS